MIKIYINSLAVVLIMVALNSAHAENSADTESIEQFNHSYYSQICEGVITCSDNVGIAENLQLAKITNVELCVVIFRKRDGPKKWQDTITQKTTAF